MPLIAAPPSAADSRPRWPTVYRPVWKLLAISVVVGIAGVIATVAAFIKEDTGGTCPTCSDPSPMPIFVLLGIGLLLWGSAVVGWAVKKDSSWSASLVAGLVAVVSVSAVWLL